MFLRRISLHPNPIWSTCDNGTTQCGVSVHCTVDVTEHRVQSILASKSRCIQSCEIIPARGHVLALSPDAALPRRVAFGDHISLSSQTKTMKGDWFVDFLLRHKATRRRLSMSNMSLATVRPSWRGLFTRISGQLPHLHKVNIHGGFHRDNRPSTFFEHKCATESRAFNQALQEFTLRGGKYPTENSVRRQARQSAADKIDHYPLPHVMSNIETLSDDPMLNYESDDYDDWFER